MQIILYSYKILKKPYFSQQSFEKISSIKFHEIDPVKAKIFHADRRTDMPK
jgi:hypothetical protein